MLVLRNKFIALGLGTTIILTVPIVFAYDKPLLTEDVVEETTGMPPVVKSDYEEMTRQCYDYLSRQDIGVYEAINYEYADGDPIVKDSMVYVADPIYMDDLLLLRFVSDVGELYSIVANNETAVDINNIAFMENDSEYTASVPNFMPDQNDAMLQVQSKVVECLNLQVNTDIVNTEYLPFEGGTMSFSHSVFSFVRFGRSMENLGYYDVCVLQYSLNDDIRNFVVHITEYLEIINIDEV